MKTLDLPKAEASLTPRYVSQLGIKSYDIDNLYPQNAIAIIQNSKTGYGCLKRYQDYLEGNGIRNQALASLAINRKGETLNDLHSLLAYDLAAFNGYAIHVNYNVFGLITELQHIPFENVRLCEPDDDGNILKVAIHPDWTGRLTRNGRPVRVKAENVDYINVFDPKQALEQMQIAGGPQYYKGQVYYFSRSGYMEYPLASFDSILTDLSTDEGLSNLMLRNARMNFIPAGAWVHYKGQGQPGAEDEGYYSTPETEGYYSDELKQLQGDNNALKIMDFTIESAEDKPEFIKIQGENIDKEFTATASELKDCIYSAFQQEGFLSLRNGKVGFSGTLVQDITEDYANKCVKLQNKLTESYWRLLSLWSEDLPAVADQMGLAILPKVYTPSSATVNAK